MGVIRGMEHGCEAPGIGFDPVIRCPLWPAAVRRTHGCCCFDTPYRRKTFQCKLPLAAGSDQSPGGGPTTHDDLHLPATGRTTGSARLRRGDPRRLAIDGERVCLPNHAAQRVGRDGTAGMQTAAVADCHAAVGQDVLEEPVEKLHDVEMGGAWACTARCTGGDGDGAVYEAYDTSLGDGDPEDRRGQGGEGRIAMRSGLTMDVPGDGPDLGVAMLQPSGVAHIFFEDGSGER